MIENKSDKFLNAELNINGLQIIEARKLKKPIIKFVNRWSNSNEELLVVGWEKIGMLAELLDVGRSQFKTYVKNGNVNGLNHLLKMADKKIKMFASLYEGNYYIFNFSTEAFTLITFTEVRKAIKAKVADMVESEFNQIIVWEKKFNSFDLVNDKFDIMLRITSGRNTKDSAIKVIVYVRVGSCNNTIQAATFSSIKHLSNWNSILNDTIDKAIKNIDIIKATIELGVETQISIEQGNQYIDSLKFQVKDEGKIGLIKSALKTRFAHEFSLNQTKFALSQAFSFLGSHIKEEAATEATLEELRKQAYEVLV